MGDVVRASSRSSCALEPVLTSFPSLSLLLARRLSYHAFRRVLSRQRAAYAPLLDLVAEELRNSALDGAQRHLGKVVSSEKNGFADRASRAKRAGRS